MGFWFFRKKRVVEDESSRHLVVIADQLRLSFSKIREDMGVVRDWLSYFKTKDEDVEVRLKNIESRLDELGEVIAYIHENQAQEPPQAQLAAPILESAPKLPDLPEKRISTGLFDDLTETQKAIFLRLGVFQAESGRDWTAIKAVAQDLYPNKEYDRVRSTISEYLGILGDAGLVEKVRRGKQTYVRMTPTGEEFFKKSRPTVKKKATTKK